MIIVYFDNDQVEVLDENSGPDIDRLVENRVLVPLADLNRFVDLYGTEMLSAATLQHIEDQKSHRICRVAGRRQRPSFLIQWAQVRDAFHFYTALMEAIDRKKNGRTDLDLSHMVEELFEEELAAQIEKICCLDNPKSKDALEIVRDLFFSNENFSKTCVARKYRADRRLANLFSQIRTTGVIEQISTPQRFKIKAAA